MLYKYYVVIELFFPKVSMLIRQVHLKNASFVTIVIFSKRKILGFSLLYVIAVATLMMMDFVINNVAIFNIHIAKYYCIISGR